MTAQSIDRPRKKQTTATTKRPTPKQQKIIETKTEHPDLTTREIAAIANTDHTHVIKTLQRYGIDRVEADAYTKHRTQIFSGLQHKILSTITDADIKEATLLQRMTAAGILYDKERIELGLGDATKQPLVLILRDRIIDRMPVDNSQIIDVDSAPLIESTT
jgi:hypothetical protein